jgi:hypothetical protein
MWRFLLLSAGLLSLLGCDSKKTASATVSGTVMYNGKAVNGAVLNLFKTTGAGDSINIPVSQEGTFRVSDVPEGEYKVIIQPSAGFSQNIKGWDKAKIAEYQSKIDEMKTPATIPIPDKYKKLTSSDLKMTIVKGEQTINFELKD